MSVLVRDNVRLTLFSMAFPMLAGTFAMNAYSLTDAWFVSRLGTLALAAMGFTFPVVMLMTCVARGIGIGVTTLVSHAIGRHDEAAAEPPFGRAKLLLSHPVATSGPLVVPRPVATRGPRVAPPPPASRLRLRRGRARPLPKWVLKMGTILGPSSSCDPGGRLHHPIVWDSPPYSDTTQWEPGPVFSLPATLRTASGSAGSGTRRLTRE